MVGYAPHIRSEEKGITMDKGKEMSILFKNNGLIDLDFVRSFGVSVKDNDSPIGFFGTGLKYAIAILLRHKQAVSIYVGKKEYKFTTTKKIKRGKAFEFVTMNGEVLGYTTELGKKWDMWQAFRELYSNCKDEYGDVFRANPEDECEDGVTVISVSGLLFEDWYANKEQVVLFSDPLCSTKSASVHPKLMGIIFYKGIRVAMENDALFDYNIKEYLDLTEDRTVKYDWQPSHRICDAWLCCTDKILLKKTLSASKKIFEGKLDYSYSVCSPSKEFVSVVEQIVSDGITNVNSSALKACRKVSANLNPTSCELSEVQKSQLKKAKKVLGFMGYNVDKYPIIVAEDLGNSCLGMAENETIYIAKRCFHMGTKMVTSTLFEEYIHLRYNLKDNTYEMQNFLFDIIFSTVEEYGLKEAI